MQRSNLDLACEVRERTSRVREGQQRLLAAHASNGAKVCCATQTQRIQELEEQVAALSRELAALRAPPRAHEELAAVTETADVAAPRLPGAQARGLDRELSSAAQAAHDALDTVLDHCQLKLEAQGESIEAIFSEMDTDRSSDLSADELAAFLSRLGVPAQSQDKLHMILADMCGGSSDRVGVDELRRRIDVHRERRRLADLLKQETNFAHLVARLVLPSHLEDDVESLATQGSAILLERLSPLVSRAAAEVIKVSTSAQAQHLSRHAQADSGGNSKFAMEAGGDSGLVAAMFGDVGLFRRGLDDLIGRPSADVERAMEKEHCSDDGADAPFYVRNYKGSEHTPREEFAFVINPQADKLYPQEWAGPGTEGRLRRDLGDLMQIPKIVETGVTRAELAALRLYTGPMYIHYNGELRKALAYYLKARARDLLVRYRDTPDTVKTSDLEACMMRLCLDSPAARRSGAQVGQHAMDQQELGGMEEGEEDASTKARLAARLQEAVVGLPADRPRFRFVTTIHMATSCIIKLSSAMRCPPERLLYRGVSGVQLPQCFFRPDQLGFRGGVDPSFMSTTLRRDVALFYTRLGKRPMIFELQVGQVDRGADVGVISQYPGENEITFPPLSNIEAVAEPRVMLVEGKEVLVLPSKINVNLKSLNREQLVSLRQTHLLDALNNNLHEIGQTLTRRLDEMVALDKGKKNSFVFKNGGHAVVDKILAECNRTVQRHRNTRPEDYNTSDHTHQLALQEVASMPNLAGAKFEAWCSGDVFVSNFDALSMSQWAAARLARRYKAYRAATNARPPDLLRLRAAARSLATERGLVSLPLDAAGRVVLEDGLARMHTTDVRGLDAMSGPDDNTALIRAVAHANLEDVRLLLDAGCSIDARDGKGYTALASCMVYGYESIASELIARGASLEATTDRGESIVLIASRFGRVDLLDAVRCACCPQIFKALVLCQMKNGLASLHIAVQQDHIEVVKLLVEAAGREALVLTPKNGISCLSFAVQKDRLEIARVLVQAGGRELLMMTDTDGMSCLFTAARLARLRHVELLIPAGGRELLTLCTKLGTSCLYVSAKFGHMKVVQALVSAGGQELLMLTNGDGFSCLHAACLNDHAEIVKVLLDAGGRALVHLVDRSGMSVMHSLVSAAGKTPPRILAMFEVLCSFVGAAALECRDESSHLGWTPIHNAVYRGQQELTVGLVDLLCSVKGLSPDTHRDQLIADAEEEVQLFRDEQHSLPLALYRGVPQTAKIRGRGGTVDFVGFSTVRSSYGCPAGTKVYYEICLLRLDATPQFGFATAAFQNSRENGGRGVGDDGESWAVDGVRRRKFHKLGDGTAAESRTGEEMRYEGTWQDGDVIGLCCDLVLGQILVSVNGDFSAPHGRVFESNRLRDLDSMLDLEESGAGVGEGRGERGEGREQKRAESGEEDYSGRQLLFAACSGQSGMIQCNLGDHHFRFPVPDGFVAFSSFSPHAGRGARGEGAGQRLDGGL